MKKIKKIISSYNPIVFFKLLIWSNYVKRICYFHTGFDDRSLIWIVNNKVYDLMFVKIR